MSLCTALRYSARHITDKKIHICMYVWMDVSAVWFKPKNEEPCRSVNQDFAVCNCRARHVQFFTKFPPKVFDDLSAHKASLGYSFSSWRRQSVLFDSSTFGQACNISLKVAVGHTRVYTRTHIHTYIHAHSLSSLLLVYTSLSMSIMSKVTEFYSFRPRKLLL